MRTPIALLALVLLGCRPAEPAEPAACCVAAQLVNGWCASCDVGYVGGQRIASKMLFEALDAHGHDLDVPALPCATCQDLARRGGFCEACRYGWIDGQAYMTRTTYHLALGEPRDPATVRCASCAAAIGDVGWCDACGGGFVGNVYFRDRDDHAAAARELGRLRATIEASRRCETCALVMLVDGRCPFCKIGYKDGQAVAASGG